MSANDFLPEPLPDNPLPMFAQWFHHAKDQHIQNNPDAMTLATVDANGRPSARIVLCKHLIDTHGYVVFFTNYESRKGQALAAHPYAAAVFHWDSLERQVRIEGRIVQSPADESDAYFRSRALASQLGAWASEQSQPLSSRNQLLTQVAKVSAKFAAKTLTGQLSIPRPPHWGGFRLWIEHIELWVSGPGRVHDRARWSRELTPNDAFSFTPGSWRSTRLNP
ncbi:MAG: pyridoxamine 5'-phosphate oxidase [Steroidobacteraceae bacterium]